MSRTFTHRGYVGSGEMDLESNCLFGQILFIDDAILYQGRTVEELRQSFVEAVDDYLESCRVLGKSPDKPFTGTFNVRLAPELHKQLAYKARKLNLTLNATVERAVEQFLESDEQSTPFNPAVEASSDRETPRYS